MLRWLFNYLPQKFIIFLHKYINRCSKQPFQSKGAGLKDYWKRGAGGAPSLAEHSHSPRCILQASDQPLLSSVNAAAISSLFFLLFLKRDLILPMYNSFLSCAHRVALLSYSSFIRVEGIPLLCRLSKGKAGDFALWLQSDCAFERLFRWK